MSVNVGDVQCRTASPCICHA